MNNYLGKIKGHNSVTNLLKMKGDHPNLDLVNITVHIEFGQILSISSQDIERKQKSGINQGQKFCYKLTKNYK